MEEITVDCVKDPADYWKILDVMRDAWSMPDYTEAVPPHLLRAAEDNGGLVLAAYTSKGEIVGFVFGIVGRKEGKLYHYSHMLGVRRKYWGRGIGYRLKVSQKEWALKQGFDLVAWTYDPHQGLNANFNFSKLGVICNKFYRDYYGIMKDGINRGLHTDRFKVEWWVKSERVTKRLSGEFRPPRYNDVESLATSVVETFLDGDGVRRISGVKLDVNDDLVLVEVPGDVNELRKKGLRLANEWKLKLRPVFESYFSRGYYATEFISIKEGDERRNFYLLWRAHLAEILGCDVPWR